jgi:5'-nucleotidase
MKLAEPIALFDLDGTLADFDGEMRARLAELRSPNEDPKLDETVYEDEPHMKARRRLIKSRPGFWRNLARIKLGFQLLEEARAQQFRCHVLSKGPRKVPLAWEEKVCWCNEHIPDLPIILAEDKGLVYGKVLVDDWVPYITRWIDWRPRGLVIAVAQPWNVDVEQRFPQNVIRYTGSNFARVQERLQLIRATAGD